MRYIFAIAVIAIAVTAIFVVQPLDAPANRLTAKDRAAWGIGEDGTRIVPQPEPIRIFLK
jgi:hypothetical protein